MDTHLEQNFLIRYDMEPIKSKIKIYGADRCHKSTFYITYFEKRNIPFEFYDVEENEVYAEELRSLYENRKLNFPTILIGDKKLRNPNVEELTKWLIKKEIMSNAIDTNELKHIREKRQFHLDLDGETGIVRYEVRDEVYYLVHAEVPFALRGQGFGKILVEKTFEYIEAEDGKAVAICPYIKAVARRNKKWSWVG